MIFRRPAKKVGVDVLRGKEKVDIPSLLATRGRLGGCCRAAAETNERRIESKGSKSASMMPKFPMDLTSSTMEYPSAGNFERTIQILIFRMWVVFFWACAY